MNLRLAVAAALAGAIIGVGGAAVVGSPPDPAPARADGFEGFPRPGFAAPELRGLRDQDGEPVRLADLRGDVVAVAFLYTTCEDACPLIAQQIRGALDDLERDAAVLAVSVDPAGDTPASARRFLLEQGLTGRMRFLVGERAALERQWRSYYVQPRSDRPEDHTASVVLLDREGRQRVSIPVGMLSPEALAHDIRALRAAR